MIDKEKPDQPAVYQIRVQGQVDASWSDWFHGMSCAYRDGITTFTGPIADQAALRGILSKIWDLNLTVISVNNVDDRTNADRAANSCHKPNLDV